MVRAIGASNVDDPTVKAIPAVSLEDEPPRTSASNPKSSRSRISVGYVAERNRIQEVLETWQDDNAMRAIVVEAPSGFGKSALMDDFVKTLRTNGINEWYGARECKTHSSYIFSTVRITKENTLIPFSAITPVVHYMVKLFVEDVFFDKSIKLRASGSRINLAHSASNCFLTTNTGSESRQPSIRDDSPVPLGSHRNTLAGAPSHLPAKSNSQGNLPAGGASILTFLEGSLTDLISPEMLSIYLIRMSEDPGLMGLLVGFFPWLKTTPSDAVKNLAPTAKNAVIVNLVGRLIGKWARNKRTVLLFDDMQQLLLFLGSRPLKDLDFKALSSGVNLNTIVHIRLQGLKREDLSSYLRNVLGDSIKAIEKDMVTLLAAKTSMVPLAMELFVDVLYRHRNDIFRSSDTKESVKKVEELLDNNLEQTILVQFNSLAPAFRELLKRAAILGQYFTLDDIADLMGPPCLNVKELLALIDQEDAFSFLSRKPQANTFENAPSFPTQPSTPRRDRMTLKQGNRKTVRSVRGSGQASQATLKMCFRHHSILTAIYDGMSEVERKRMHEEVAAMFERKMLEQDNMDLIPVLYNHYVLSGNVEKRIFYAEELGYLYDRLSYIKEACIIFCDLITFTSSLPPSAPIFQDPLRQAGWYAAAASTATVAWQHDLVLEYSTKALELLGIILPSMETVRATAVIKELFRHIMLFLQTRGGRNGSSMIPKDRVTRAHHASRAILALMWMLYPKTAIPINFKLLGVLQLLNVTTEISAVNPAAFANSCFSFAFLLMLTNSTLAKVYWRAGRDAAKRCDPEELALSFAAYSAVVSSLSEDSLAELEDFSLKFQEVFLRQGDLGQWRVARNLMFYARHPKTPDEAKELFLPKLMEINEVDFYAAEYCLLLAGRCAITFKDMGLLEFCRDQSELNCERLMQKYNDFPVHFNIPRTMFKIWELILEKEYVPAVDFLSRLAESFLGIPTLNYFNGLSRFAFYGIWPVLTHLDAKASSDVLQAEHLMSRLVLCTERVRDRMREFAKHICGDDLHYRILFAAQAILMGKTRRAKKLLAPFFRKHVKTFWGNREPLWFGIANGAMFLMDGDVKWKEASLSWFEGCSAATFTEWISGAVPLVSLLARRLKMPTKIYPTEEPKPTRPSQAAVVYPITKLTG
ncbi:hypothetical protein HDU96_005418 [Phlyctochytrium bullatum]|nr:hypothetical protein HDU96_005418 [Phlyctochytrium bullatum]